MSRSYHLHVVLILLAMLFGIIASMPQSAEAVIQPSEGCNFLNSSPSIDDLGDGYFGFDEALPFNDGEFIYIEVEVTGGDEIRNQALAEADASGLVSRSSRIVFGVSSSGNSSFSDPEGRGNYVFTEYDFDKPRVLSGIGYHVIANEDVNIIGRYLQIGADNASITTYCGYSLDFPNLGLIQISTAQAQPVYDSAGGGVVRDAGGNELWLPQDYDGNGFDTFTITGFAEIDGQEWYSIWLGSENYGWVPAANVTRLE